LKEQICIKNSIGTELVLIQAGEFDMGSNRSEKEKPIHRVTISSDFYIGKFPITQKEWIQVMKKNPSQHVGENKPVGGITWKDAQEFVRKLKEKENTDKYRLASEAEWEYAARAGTTTVYSFGDDISKLRDYAWYGEMAGFNSVHPVGQKIPNSWGLYDMHGNVWEWVQDKYHEGYDGAPVDGSAREDDDLGERARRGGAWVNSAKNCSSAFRRFSREEFCCHSISLRLVKEV
jgi:formylglycine-generating enzyme required for sulfatase activity